MWLRGRESTRSRPLSHRHRDDPAAATSDDRLGPTTSGAPTYAVPTVGAKAPARAIPEAAARAVGERMSVLDLQVAPVIAGTGKKPRLGTRSEFCGWEGKPTQTRPSNKSRRASDKREPSRP